MNVNEKLKPCPFCGDAWVYASTGDYGSGYEHYGYRVDCRCHYAWSVIGWYEHKADVILAWNRRAENV